MLLSLALLVAGSEACCTQLAQSANPKVVGKLVKIIDALGDKDVQLSVSTYRDNNVDNPWYETSGGLVGGTNQPKNFLESARATGGGDIAESLLGRHVGRGSEDRARNGLRPGVRG